MAVNFTDDEVKLAKELRRLGFPDKPRGQTKSPPANPACQAGQYFWARRCPKGCCPIQENVFMVTESNLDDVGSEGVWLPTFDEGLEVARTHGISFAQITDFMHRRRFADGREREGLYQLFLEIWR